MNLTPRQFKAQLDVHADIQKQMNGAKSQRQTQPVESGFIDQLKGW